MFHLQNLWHLGSKTKTQSKQRGIEQHKLDMKKKIRSDTISSRRVGLFDQYLLQHCSNCIHYYQIILYWKIKLAFIMKYNKMKNNQIPHWRSSSNIKVKNRWKKQHRYPQHAKTSPLIFPAGSGTSIKCGRVKLVLCVQIHILRIECQCIL